MIEIDESSIKLYENLREGVVIKGKETGEILYFNNAYKSSNKVDSEFDIVFKGIEAKLYILNSNIMEDFATIFESFIKENKGKKITLLKTIVENYYTISKFHNNEYGRELIQDILSYLSKSVPNAVKYLINHINKDSYLLYLGSKEKLYREIEQFISVMSTKYKEIKSHLKFSACEIKDYDESFVSYDQKLNFAYNYSRSKYNNFFVFDEKVRKRILYVQEVIENFDTAIKNKDFKIYIQPKYDLKTSTFFGGEVLTRWNYKGEMISPDEYIPILEETGLIKILDRYVFQETIKILRMWVDMELIALPLSVNFSRANFDDENLFTDFLSMVDSYKIPHELIQLEITETAFEHLDETMEDFIAECKANGFMVSIDDFGNGYSSLSSLKDLDVSGIKINYADLKNSRIKNRGEKIIESAMNIAQTLGFNVIIEGVENSNDVELMRELGVRYVQGFYFSKPISVFDFEKLDKLPVDMNKDNNISNVELEEIRVSSSPTNFFFRNSLSKAALFKYKDNKLTPIIMNGEFRDAIPLYNSYKDIASFELFSLVNKSDYPKLKKYVDDVVEGKEVPKNIIVNFEGKQKKSDKVRATLIKSSEDVQTLYMEFVTVSEDITKNISIENLDILFSAFYKLGVCAIDESGIVRYANSAMKGIVNNIIVGNYTPVISPAGLTLADLISKNNKSYYFQFTNILTNISVTKELLCENHVLKVSFFYPISSGYSSNQFRFMGDFVALGTVSDIYTEINLTQNSFTQVRFEDDEIKDYAINGNYDEASERFIDAVDPTDKKKVRALLSREFLLDTLRRNFHYKFKYKLNGINKWHEASFSYAKDNDDEYAVSFIWDATEDIIKDFDNLTGILNRRAGIRSINNFISNNPNVPMAFVIIDLDDLKTINDTFGHPYGDKAVATIGKSLNDLDNYRVPVKLRLGGDEFIILIYDVDSVGVNEIINESKKKVELYSKELEEIKLKFTTGIAFYPSDGLTFDSLYTVSDNMLYQNKKLKKVGR